MSEPPVLSSSASFAEIAAALRDIALWERSRIHLVEHLARTGQARDPGGLELGGWLRRAALVTEGADIFTVLSAHEPEVRALDPLLIR